MSSNEMGSHSRARALVITRSTARRCDAIVSSRHAEFWLTSNISLLNCSTSCIFSQCLAQLSGNGDGNYLFALALHARDLLLAAGDQLFAGGVMPPVLKIHRDAVLA